MSAIVIKDKLDTEYLIPVSNIAFIEHGGGKHRLIVLRAGTLPSGIETKETFERLRNLLNCAYMHAGVFYYADDGSITALRTHEQPE